MDHKTVVLPPLDTLRFFEAAARAGSFSAASHALNVTHGAVSRQIAKLEHWVGRRLFDRHGRGVSLTPDGGRPWKRRWPSGVRLTPRPGAKSRRPTPMLELGDVPTDGAVRDVEGVRRGTTTATRRRLEEAQACRAAAGRPSCDPCAQLMINSFNCQQAAAGDLRLTANFPDVDRHRRPPALLRRRPGSRRLP